jgi:hypothetical protein
MPPFACIKKGKHQGAGSGYFRSNSTSQKRASSYLSCLNCKIVAVV